MRVAIVAECFLPEVNGVTNTVLRISERLSKNGHDVMIVAPGPGPEWAAGATVVRVPSMTLPVYRSLQVGRPTSHVVHTLEAFAPDVIHLAAPAVLGMAGLQAAEALGVPSVAVFQTDLVGFARRYHLSPLAPPLWSWLRRLHNRATVTLAPSTSTAWELRAHGVERVELWARGVDTERFTPAHRDRMLRRRLSPDRRPIVGYIGRLAREKQVGMMAAVDAMPGVRPVVVGDGPLRSRLERALSNTEFLGFLHGDELARAAASLDVFVHTGANETFCQALQEAMAAGVPVVAPAAGGPLDLVRHGATGFLYPPGDEGHLAEAVRTLVGDKPLRRRLGAAARESVLHRTWPAVVDDLISRYRTLTGAASPGSGPERVQAA
ncbi:MAG: glycosyltransferase family 1 protein [Acidimicrobiia bacterium]|nr:glycosyltransferase family 1 protein [Acidimicrobiia bacterium]